jgi:XRE family aerobic/anaerobic benzoate catabolism transcriptional regulator
VTAPDDDATIRPILRTLSARVRALRGAQGLTRQDLAALSALSVRFLAQVESGKGNISIGRLADLARALGVTPGSLLEATSGPPPDPGQRPVVALLGLRGAGKSTLGRQVAEELNVGFQEHDRLVEDAAGMELGELFPLRGEVVYRDLARETLERFLSDQAGRPCILATGGGVVTDPVALDLLQCHTHTVWLRATADDHWRRVIEHQGDQRPREGRADARRELARLLAHRRPLYARAAHRIDTSLLGLEGSRQALLDLASGCLAGSVW